jgi:hypothetical protein
MTFINPWTDEAVEQLKALYASGDSCSEIARTLPINVTRNAVIGKVHRLKLERRGQTAGTKKSVKRRSPRPRVKRVKNSLFATGWISGPSIAPSLPDFYDPVGDPLNVTFADIQPGQCRSIGNDDVHAPLYCGHAVVPGTAWCAGHRALYYRPVPAGKKTREAA